MSIKTGTYTGNDNHQAINIGFKPEFVITCSVGVDHCGVKIEDFWCARSNVLSATDSYINGAQFTDNGFALGPSTRWNKADTVYHYLAIARSSNFKISFAGLQGNGQSNRVVNLDDPLIIPSAVIGKRDSPRDAILQVGTQISTRLGGVALQEVGAITNLAQGQFTVSSSVYVNEYNPAAELGEGIDFIAFETGSNFTTTTYTGTGATQTVSLPFQPSAVILAKISGSVITAGRIKTDTMTGDMAKVFSDVSGVIASGITLVAGGVQLSATSSANTNGDTYALIAFKNHTETPLSTPSIVKTGKKAIFLPARTSGSHINCGNNDSLVVDGPLTLEWMGSIEPIGRDTPVPFIWRGNATTNTALSCSFALYANGFVGSPGNWSGPSIAIGCGDRLDLLTTSTQIRSSWRTGLLLDYGKLTHLMATHNGTGGWNFYKNGKLVRQRNLNLVSDGNMPNIDGVSGHTMIIGGMMNGGTVVNNLQRQRFQEARIYNRALTTSEVEVRFARAGLGSQQSDITSGLVESWNADNASGLILPASVNSANNGSIVNGQIQAL